MRTSRDPFDSIFKYIATAFGALLLLSLGIMLWNIYTPSPILLKGDDPKMKIMKLYKEKKIKKLRWDDGVLYVTLTPKAFQEALQEQKSERKTSNLIDMVPMLSKLFAEQRLTQEHAQGPHYIIYTRYESFSSELTEFCKKKKLDKYLEIGEASLEVGYLVLAWSFFMRLLFAFFPLFLLMQMGVFRQMGDSEGYDIFGEEGEDDEKKRRRVKFKDVKGLRQPKRELAQVIDMLIAPNKYRRLGARLPKGFLLSGPPGTGKTLLAKAVAGEANVPFLYASGTSFIEVYVGVGPRRVRSLFEKARQCAPCIVYIDEIDAIGGRRGNNVMSSGYNESDQTLMQLLQEMDGFDVLEKPIIVLGSTNRKNVLDSALTRSGRFDVTITTSNPTLAEREETFEYYLQRIEIEKENIGVTPTFLAKQTVGFSYADIANSVNIAALIAGQHEHEYVTKEDFQEAFDRQISGFKTGLRLNEKELDIVAKHEAGHAVVSWALENTDPLVKVTVVPRSEGALGFAQYLPDEKHLRSKSAMLARCTTSMGGRAAEEILDGEIHTGALSDFEYATKVARAMVEMYGMNDKLGPISFYDSQNPDGNSFLKPYADGTALIVDQEVTKILKTCYKEAKSIITTYKDKVEEVAKVLVEKETILGEEFMEIMGTPPYKQEKKTATKRKTTKKATKKVVKKKEEKISEEETSSDAAPEPSKD